MATLMGVIPIPVLDEKQAQMMVVGVTAAMLWANWAWVMSLPNMYINTVVQPQRR